MRLILCILLTLMSGCASSDVSDPQRVLSQQTILPYIVDGKMLGFKYPYRSCSGGVLGVGRKCKQVFKYYIEKKDIDKIEALDFGCKPRKGSL